jgi:imidazole glycerol-phosphate synthase subunit HisH
MITIIDYGTSNVGSVQNMLKKLGHKSLITSNPEELIQASKIILPGVGLFDVAMTNLKNLGIIEALNQKVIAEKTPLLGICLGMQLLTGSSEEGTLPGLGYIAGKTVKFKLPESSRLKVPHMGWSKVEIKKSALLFDDISKERFFYFVHTYHVVCDDPADILTETHYGYTFTSALERGHIMATQYHPEKSHKFGIEVLKNFADQSPNQVAPSNRDATVGVVA